MPMLEFFALAAEEEAGAAAAEALAGDALTAEMAGGVGAGITDAAMLGGEYAGGLGAGMGGAGITGANSVAAGGIGAGAGTNAAVAAQQGFSGIAPMADPGAYYEAGSGVAGPMAPDLQIAHANIDAANAGGGSGIGSALEKGYKAFKELPGSVQFLGGMAAINALGLNKPQGQFNAQPYEGPLNKYRLSPNFRGYTANPQNYQYAPRYAAGGILAAGGPVEQMSNNAAIGANTMYPMANMATSAFATPYQDPKSTSVLAPTVGGAVNQMTGELSPQGTRFAAGGVTGSGGINLNIPIDIGGGGGGGMSAPSDFFGSQGGGGQFQNAFAGLNNTSSGGGNYNSSLGVSGPPNFSGMAHPAYQNLPQGNTIEGDTFQPTQPVGTSAFSGTQGILKALGSMLQGQGQQSNQMQSFAKGGVAHFARGNLAESLNYYDDMMEGPAKRQIAAMQTPAAGSHDVGIYRDTDPDTMYLSPREAAQVRMAKLNKRANMQMPSMKRPTPMGQLNLRPQGVKAGDSGSSLDPEYAAQGGIMQASGHLGGYAAGGQPRLLKGPGDGMSDDIPATIANKQPARLADGEFVVPADVVSHLGNGSTDAGSKKLHSMMDNVRKARTGRKAQGKQINPNRFMPK